MAEMRDVLGAVLRGLGEARVTGDLLARDLAGEYRDDPILSGFPVPRVEMREATIALRFAVNGVEKRPADRTPIVRETVLRAAPSFSGAALLGLVGASPQPDEMKDLLARREATLRGALDAATVGAAADATIIEAVAKGDLGPLIEWLRTELPKSLLADREVRRILGARDAAERLAASLEGPLRAEVEGLNATLKDRLVRLPPDTFAIDLAVTRKDLVETPETLMSSITVVAEIRNYAWTAVGESDGEPVLRLLPE